MCMLTVARRTGELETGTGTETGPWQQQKYLLDAKRCVALHCMVLHWIGLRFAMVKSGQRLFGDTSWQLLSRSLCFCLSLSVVVNCAQP